MAIGTRDDLSQLDARVFPAFGLVAITEIIGRACSVKHDQLTEIVFATQHVPQGERSGATPVPIATKTRS